MNRFEGDTYFAGNVTAQSMTLPASAVTDTAVQAAAGVAYSKLDLSPRVALCLCDHATAVAVTRQQVYRVYGATASLLAFGLVNTVAATSDATATVTLLKNGSTILTGSITLDSSVTAYTFKQPGGYTSTSLVAGDVLEVSVSAVSAGAGALPKGVTAYLYLGPEKAS